VVRFTPETPAESEAANWAYALKSTGDCVFRKIFAVLTTLGLAFTQPAVAAPQINIIVKHKAAIPAFVQGTTCHHDGSGAATCILNGVAATHTIHVFQFGCGGAGGFSSSLGLTYTRDINGGPTPDSCNFRTVSVALFRAPVGASSGTESINATADGSTITNIYMIMEEWSGETQTGGAGARDGSNVTAAVSAGPTISSGSFSTAASGDLLVAGAYGLAHACTLTAGSGFTIHNSQTVADLSGFGAGCMAIETKVTGAAGSYSGDFTLGGGNNGWVVAAVAYLHL
jgi:hypothetical protein